MKAQKNYFHMLIHIRKAFLFFCKRSGQNFTAQAARESRHMLLPSGSGICCWTVSQQVSGYMRKPEKQVGLIKRTKTKRKQGSMDCWCISVSPSLPVCQHDVSVTLNVQAVFMCLFEHRPPWQINCVVMGLCTHSGWNHRVAV